MTSHRRQNHKGGKRNVRQVESTSVGWAPSPFEAYPHTGRGHCDTCVGGTLPLTWLGQGLAISGPWGEILLDIPANNLGSFAVSAFPCPLYLLSWYTHNNNNDLTPLIRNCYKVQVSLYHIVSIVSISVLLFSWYVFNYKGLFTLYSVGIWPCISRMTIRLSVKTV